MITTKGTIAGIGLSVVSLAVGFCVSQLQRVSAAAAPPIITTQALRIVDGQGNLRAALSVNPQSGTAGLSIFEPNNTNPRVIVSVRSDGAGDVELRDPSGSPRLIAGMDPQSDSAGISMFEPNKSTPRLVVGVKSGGNGNVELRDSDGNKRGELTATSTGEIRLSFIGKDLKSGVVLGSSGGKTMLVFNDSQPKQRALFGLSSSGDPSVEMYDKDGKTIWQAGHTN
jgi:hypothetical protein